MFVVLLVSIALAAPFIWAFIAQRPGNLAYKEMWLNNQYNRGPLLIIEITRVVLGIAFIVFWITRLAPTIIAFVVGLLSTVLVLWIFSSRIRRFYRRIESRFISNFNAREIAAANADSVSAQVTRNTALIQSSLGAWDAHISELEVQPDANYVAKPLSELAWREKYSINIVYIKRGDKLIHTPQRDSKLLPFDRVGIISTDEQMQQFKPEFDKADTVAVTDVDTDDIVLQQIMVDEHTKLKGLDIRSSGIRERTQGLVIGIERHGERMLNPDSTTIFEWGDIVWIVGVKKKIQQFISKSTG